MNQFLIYRILSYYLIEIYDNDFLTYNWNIKLFLKKKKKKLSLFYNNCYINIWMWCKCNNYYERSIFDHIWSIKISFHPLKEYFLIRVLQKIQYVKTFFDTLYKLILFIYFKIKFFFMSQRHKIIIDIWNEFVLKLL